MLGAFNKIGKSNSEVKIFEYIKKDHPIGLDYLEINNLINEYVDHMSTLYVLNVQELLESDSENIHGAKERAWEEIKETINNNINNYELDKSFDYFL